MVRALQPFAGIVQKQRQEKQLRGFDLRQKFGEGLRSFDVCGFQLMQYVDGHQRVFVDRVTVIKVAQHKQIDGFEFRHGVRQQVQRMHGAQRVGRMGKRQGFAQLRPQSLVLRHGVRQALMSLVDAALGFGAEGNAMLRHKNEQPQDRGSFARIGAC